MSTVLPVQAGTNISATTTTGNHVAIGANGRINVICSVTGKFYIYSALPTDTEFVKTTDITTAFAGQNHNSMWSVSGDYIHVIWSLHCLTVTAANSDNLSYRRISLSDGSISNTMEHSDFNSAYPDNRMGGHSVRGFPDGSAILTFIQNQAYRTMGNNYKAPVFIHISPAGAVTKQVISPTTATNTESNHQMFYNDMVFCRRNSGAAWIDSAASYNTISGTTPGTLYVGEPQNDILQWDYGETFYDSTNGRQHCLIDGLFQSEYTEGYWTWDAGTETMGATLLGLPDIGGKPILGYHFDTSDGTRRIAYIDANTVTVQENDGGGWDGFVSYQNTTFASQKANLPVGIYDNGAGLRACAVFGNDAEGYEVAFDIELVSVGSLPADIDITVSQAISQTIAATLEHGGEGLSVAIAQAISQAITGSLTSLPLDLQQGWESRYQANEPGELLERNIYRAYVGATEFPLYSISASFSGLDAFTSDPSGSAYITLKAPISQRDYLTSQIGQEFIVLNGVETAGVFQGVEFVRGTIDEVKSAGDFVVVSTSRTEQFSAGVVATIDTGIEFVSRQRIRFGRINPTLRPGARVITPRGTYDVAQLTYFVGPRQKFMEISAYG